MSDNIDRAYQAARERYTELGVDAELAMQRLRATPISLNCWQGDDVGGFETPDAQLSGGGIQATGNYPGKARTADQLRSDLDEALRRIPGTHRVNLHAIYGELGGRKVARNELQSSHFQGWIDWARHQGLGLDFNGSFFSHPLADSGFTLSHADAAVRRFWIEHGQVCRRIGADMGRALGTPCVTNVWIPDGYKDIPVDRMGPRRRLEEALDEVFAEKLNPAHNLDAVEAKLFGIGSESYVVGSHEFYLLYALRRGTLLCLDAGHFHPTEVISDKLSSAMLFFDRILLHVSRGVRWDSDHVVAFSDELQAIAQELVRGGFLERTHVGLDFFDASINRVSAWVIGARNMLKALLMALLEPTARLRLAEDAGDFTQRLALLEECKSLPFGAVWDEYCRRQDAPVGIAWLDEVKRYEAQELPKRR